MNPSPDDFHLLRLVMRWGLPLLVAAVIAYQVIVNYFHARYEAMSNMAKLAATRHEEGTPAEKARKSGAPLMWSHPNDD